MTNTTNTTASDLETLARAIAADLGLEAKVSARESVASAKLGRQVRIRVASTGKAWAPARKIARELAARISGRVFTDRASYFETRTGMHGACRGWKTGTAIELRVYPEASK